MIKLYWNVGSQPARAVKALLDIGKIQHQCIVIDLGKSQTRTPQFLKLNPLGQIPFIVTQAGQGIGESNAIMQYLCEKYPQKLIKYYGNKDLVQKTKVNVILSWYQSYYRVSLFGRIKLKIYGVVKKGIPYTEAQLKQADHQMGQALNHLQKILKDNKYVAGNNISIADFLVYFETTNLIYYHMENILKDLPHILKWYKEIQEIPEVTAIQSKWKENAPNFIALLDSAKPTN